MKTVTELKELAKDQGVKVSSQELKDWRKVLKIVGKEKNLSSRFIALSNAGYHVKDTPMNTGSGVGTCIKRMKGGSLRIRVSANWAGKVGGNYASVVEV